MRNVYIKITGCLLHKAVIFFVVLFIAVPVVLIFGSANPAEAVVIGNIANASLGSYVGFGGKAWRLIGDNYLLLAQPELINKAYGANGDYSSSYIRPYLNNDFYNSLGVDKELVSICSWGVGNEKDENSKTVIDKVGLISYSEWAGIREIPDISPMELCWTRTPASGNIYDVWPVAPSGYYNDRSAPANYSHGSVRPALHLESGTFISGSGTYADPYIATGGTGYNNTAVLGNETSTFLGSYVAFGGKVWRLIGDNYLLLAQPEMKKIAHLSKYGAPRFVHDGNISSDYSSSDIRPYLNNEFYNSLGANKDLVLYCYWGVGNEKHEFSETVIDKVGLISYSEWVNIREIPEIKPIEICYTRTHHISIHQNASHNTLWHDYWCVNPAGDITPGASASVRPAMCLKSGLLISGGIGTASDPYTLKSNETIVIKMES